MKVSAVHTIRAPHPWKTRVFVVVETNTGRMGIGESTLGQLSYAVLGALRDLEPLVVGLDPHDVALLRQRALRDIYADGGQVTAAALAGFEMALWDLIGQAASQPLFNLLGGRLQPRLRLYANGWYRGSRDPDVIASLAQNVLERGYTALKIDPFGANWRTMSGQEMDLSLAILRNVREAVGDRVDLIVEAHARFDVATAVKIARRIESLNPLWFEEPLPYADISGYRQVTNQTAVPIAAGESFWRVGQFVQLIHETGISVVQVDPTHVGGIAAAREIAALALEEGAVVAPHSASGPVNELACAHLATASPHVLIFERFSEFEPHDPSTGVISSALHTDLGFAELEPTPGLGARFSLSALRGLHSNERLDDQNLYQPGWEMRR